MTGALFLALVLVACADPGAPDGTRSVPMARKSEPQALAAPNVVTDWAGIVQSAIHKRLRPDHRRVPRCSRR